MKKILVTLAITALSSISNAQSSAIEGNWGTTFVAGDIAFDITFSIQKNSVTVTNVCSGFGTRATAQVTSASSYNESTLTIHESKQDQQSSGSLNCDVSAVASTMNYSVQGQQLVFTQNGSSDSIVLFRK